MWLLRAHSSMQPLKDHSYQGLSVLPNKHFKDLDNENFKQDKDLHSVKTVYVVPVLYAANELKNGGRHQKGNYYISVSAYCNHCLTHVLFLQHQYFISLYPKTFILIWCCKLHISNTHLMKKSPHSGLSHQCSASSILSPFHPKTQKCWVSDRHPVLYKVMLALSMDTVYNPFTVYMKLQVRQILNSWPMEPSVWVLKVEGTWCISVRCGSPFSEGLPLPLHPRRRSQQGGCLATRVPNPNTSILYFLPHPMPIRRCSISQAASLSSTVN